MQILSLVRAQVLCHQQVLHISSLYIFVTMNPIRPIIQYHSIIYFFAHSKRIHMLRPSFSDQDRDDRASQVEDPWSPEMGQGKPPKLDVDS